MEKTHLPTPTEEEMAAFDVVCGLFLRMERAIVSFGVNSFTGKIGVLLYPNPGPSGEIVSGYSDNARDAWAIAASNFQAYEPEDKPITSATEAVEVIRKRVEAGEDVATVLDDIKVK